LARYLCDDNHQCDDLHSEKKEVRAGSEFKQKLEKDLGEAEYEWVNAELKEEEKL
jgi:hypothetical protein